MRIVEHSDLKRITECITEHGIALNNEREMLVMVFRPCTTCVVAEIGRLVRIDWKQWFFQPAHFHQIED